MGWISQQFSTTQSAPPPAAPREIAVGAKDDNSVSQTFNDKNITFTGSLAGYDYDSILRDKQRNIVRLFELSDYFVDEDPIYRGIIKEVYTPFSIADNFKLVGANESQEKIS